MKNKMASHERILIAALVAFFFSFGSFSKDVQAFSLFGKKNEADSSSSVQPGSFLYKYIQEQKPVSKGSMAQFGKKTVPIGKDLTENLANISKQTFLRMDEYGADLKKIDLAKGVLAAPPEVSEEVYEFKDAYLMVKSVSVSVEKPDASVQATPFFKSFRWKKNPEPLTLATLTPQQQEVLDHFIAKKLPGLSEQDPLKKAFRNGKEALLQAILEGKGTFKQTSAIRIPKERASKGKKAGEKPTVHSEDFRSADEAEASAGRTSTAAPGIGASGSFTYQKKFLTGFTFHDEWGYSHEWDFSIGSFSADVGAGYTFGLRVPVEVTGEFHPTNIHTKDVEEPALYVMNDIRVNTVNGDEAFYRATGLPADKVQQGHEFILGTDLHYDFNLSVGHDFHFGKQFGFDFPYDFQPPFGNQHDIADIPIPLDISNTRLNFGPLTGYAQLGFKLTGDGEVELDHQLFFDRGYQEKQSLVFRDTGTGGVRQALPPISLGRGETSAEKKYGFKISNPRYKARLFATPEIKIGAEIDVLLGSASVETDWILLNTFKVDLGQYELGGHAGTELQFSYTDGVKKFERIEPATGVGDLVYIRSDYTKLYVTGTFGLRPYAPDTATATKFKLEEAPEQDTPDIAGGKGLDPKAKDGSSKKKKAPSIGNDLLDRMQGEKIAIALAGAPLYMTVESETPQRAADAGFDYSILMRTGRVNEWSTLKMIPLEDHKVAFKLLKTGKYVSVGRYADGLYANAEQIGEKEKFTLWPVPEVKVLPPLQNPRDLVLVPSETVPDQTSGQDDGKGTKPGTPDPVPPAEGEQEDASGKAPPGPGPVTGTPCDLVMQIPTFWAANYHYGNRGHVGESGRVEFKVSNKAAGPVPDTRVDVRITNPRGENWIHVIKTLNVQAGQIPAVGNITIPPVMEPGVYTMYVEADPPPYGKNDTNRDNNKAIHGFTVLAAKKPKPASTYRSAATQSSSNTTPVSSSYLTGLVQNTISGLNHVGRTSSGSSGSSSSTSSTSSSAPATTSSSTSTATKKPVLTAYAVDQQR